LETPTSPTQLGVIFIEKNFCENIVNTVMDVSGKAKDNVDARLDLEELFARGGLHLHTREKTKTHTNQKQSTLILGAKELVV